jgi:hypothetical protein
MGKLREPPFSVFLSSNSRFIGVLIYENLLKIIPISKNQEGRIML